MLNDAITRRRRQKIDNRRVDFRRRGKGPTFFAAAANDLHDLIGQLFVNAAISFCLQLAFRDRSSVVHASAIAHRKPSG